MTRLLAILMLVALALPARAQDPDLGPDLGRGREVADGVLVHEVVVPGEGMLTTVWVYLPANDPRPKLPCALIAPAGSSSFHGMNFAEGDRPEHLPWVRAGFVVVAYSIAGPRGQDDTNGKLAAAIRAFMLADGGVKNAKVALDWALRRVSRINPERVVAVGHSSAATLALQVAASDERVKACVAFAPVAYVPERLGERALAQLDNLVPGSRAFLQRTSPSVNTNQLECRVLLFHATDDDNVPAGDTRRLHALLRGTLAERATLIEVPSGGHYQSMLEEGIPRAIRWLREAARPGP